MDINIIVIVNCGRGERKKSNWGQKKARQLNKSTRGNVCLKLGLSNFEQTCYILDRKQ